MSASTGWNATAGSGESTGRGAALLGGRRRGPRFFGGLGSGSRSLGGRRSGPRFLGGLAAVALVVGTPALAVIGGPAVASAASDTALRVVTAAPAVPAGATAIGRLSGRQVISGAVALEPRDAAGLGAFAEAVSTPSSSLYRHYLLPGQFASRFGPTAASIAAVETQLRHSGLAVTSVSANGLLVDFKGSASRVGAAFHTSIADYRLTGGRVAYSQTSAVRLPAAIAGVVQSVIGLNDLSRLQPLGVEDARRGDGTAHGRAVVPASSAVPTAGGPAACHAASAAATRYGGLTDTEIAHAYGVDGLYSAGDTGAGQTVAIFELEPYSRADIKTFDACYFGAAKAATMLGRLTNVAVDGGQQLGTGSGESALDIEDVSAVAPGAKVTVYDAPNTDSGYLDEYNTIVTQDRAKTISSSWGECEATSAEFDPGSLALENTIFEQAATQGQSLFAAAGDSGSDDCAEDAVTPTAPLLSVDDPGSQPYVTSVGGTTITDATDPPKEQVWNDGNDWGAGGGGISSTWTAPTWQVDSRAPGLFAPGVVATARRAAGAFGQDDDFCAATATARCREVPDVSAQADEFTGAITIRWAGQWVTIGGTSSSTPLWAAMLADTDATAACRLSGGVGFANPALYAVASVPGEYAASFNDVKAGNNDAYGVGGLYPSTRGYDMATGLGSPRITGPAGAPGLAYYLCSSPAAVTPAVTGVSPAAVSAATPTTITVTGRGFGTGSTSDVAGVQIGTVALPASAVTVTSPTTLQVLSPLGTAETGNGAGTDGSGTHTVSVTLRDGLTSVPSSRSRLALYEPDTGAGAVPIVDGVGPSGGNEATRTAVVIYGSGLSGATAVTFGGVAGTVDRVVSADEIDATAPTFGTATSCLAGDDPTTDVCQSQVRVTTPVGTSPTATILAEEGRAAPDTESVPAATEFDYLPTPAITSLREADGPPDEASEAGGTAVTITGKGLGELGLLWINVGPPSLASSEDASIVSESATSDTFVLPAIAPTDTIADRRVSVQTEASPNIADLAASAPSNVVRAYYDPTPTVSAVTTSNGRSDGPTIGGTTLTIHGHGFDGAEYVVFDGSGPGVDTSSATDYVIDVVGNDKIVLVTPGDDPGVEHVHVCGVSGCSAKTAATFTYYPLGRPTVSSITPKVGRAGTKVKITGKNLGFIEAVYFGKTKAKVFANGPGGYLATGDPDLITAVAPRGRAGSTVDIRVVTVESESTGASPKSPVNRAVTFHYQK